MPNIYIVIGNGNTRKSSLIRALSGVANRGKYEIEDSSSIKNEFFIQVRSLQEANISPPDFITEMQNSNVSHILAALRINTLNSQPNGASYINAFINTTGWNISGIIKMGGGIITGLPAGCTAPVQINNTNSRAANEMASSVRQTWLWK